MPAFPAPAFGLDDVEITAHERLYDGFLKIDRYRLKCRLFEGGWSREFQREVLVRHPGIGVLLYDPLLDKVLLVEQFRSGCLTDTQQGPWALELVAGLWDDASESFEAVARREAQEEAGVVVQGALLKVCEYYNSPGGSDERITVFCGRFDAAHNSGGVFGLASESENIRAHVIDRAEAVAGLRAGRVRNAMTLIALQWLELNLVSVRAALVAAA
ncbi:MAG: NUDIX domain-containing protein [Pseudomonadales bacterium]|jgi:ADP-ribose pyrophosphatase|nr:NUDIX domain-containing protein [Pseudomonadales bacterium]